MSGEPFKYVQAICYTKEDLFRLDDNNAEKEYNAFLTNRALSYDSSTIIQANEMNIRSRLPAVAQFDYLLNSVRKAKRGTKTKWAKPDKSDDLEAIKQVYGYSDRRARAVLQLLTQEQLAMLREGAAKGGRI